MTDQPKRRAAPRGAPEEQAAALRAKLLVELGKHNRTTLQLAAILELDRQVVYRSLLSLEKRGEVASFNDRRRVSCAPSLVWKLPPCAR